MESEKVKWTLDLIEKLQGAKIGEVSRLLAIKNALENGRKIYDSDKKYLQEKFAILQNFNHSQSTHEIEKTDEKRLYMISKLKEAEIGNQVRLEAMREVLLGNESLSSEDDLYLDEKFAQLQKIDDSELKIQQKLEMIDKLKLAEIGNDTKLDECKNALISSGELSKENESYLQNKTEQYKKIHKEPDKSVKIVAQTDTPKKNYKETTKTD